MIDDPFPYSTPPRSARSRPWARALRCGWGTTCAAFNPCSMRTFAKPTRGFEPRTPSLRVMRAGVLRACNLACSGSLQRRRGPIWGPLRRRACRHRLARSAAVFCPSLCGLIAARAPVRPGRTPLARAGNRSAAFALGRSAWLPKLRLHEHDRLARRTSARRKRRPGADSAPAPRGAPARPRRRPPDLRGARGGRGRGQRGRLAAQWVTLSSTRACSSHLGARSPPAPLSRTA
jgi:hypothetical protein